MIDNEIMELILKFIFAPILALIGWAWKHQEDGRKELKKHVDEQDAIIRAHAEHQDSILRAEVEKAHTILNGEVNRQRDISAKIFDKLEDMTKRSTDRHLELLQALHTGLSQKADK